MVYSESSILCTYGEFSRGFSDNMYSDMDMNDLVAEFTTRFHPFSQKHHDNRWLMISRLLEDDMAKGYDL